MDASDIPMPPLGAIELVHRLLGGTLWLVQSLEYTLCHWIVLHVKLPPARDEAEMQRLLEAHQKKTLGALFTELRKAKSSTSVDSFEQRINVFLIERNWLVHDSFRLHHADLFDEDKLAALVRRVDMIAREAAALRNIFADITTEWMLQSEGFTREELDAATAAELRKRGVIE